MSKLIKVLIVVFLGCGTSNFIKPMEVKNCPQKQQDLNQNLSSVEQPTTLLIQAFPNSVALASIIEKATPIINDIIKREVGLPKDYNFDFFLPRKNQALTLYYVNDIQEKGESGLFAKLQGIENNFGLLRGSNVIVESEANFFGGQFGVNDELVIMINDPDKMLSKLNQEIKEVVH